jgi:hypothetical protein
MGCLKEEVRARLEGQNERQSHREAARAYRVKLNRVIRLRRNGRLNELTTAEETLQSIGCTWTKWVRYGVVVLTTDTGVILPYRPDGILDWGPNATRRPPMVTDYTAQQEFPFSIESPV